MQGLDRQVIVRYLGSPLGVGVTLKQHFDWFSVIKLREVETLGWGDLRMECKGSGYLTHYVGFMDGN